MTNLSHKTVCSAPVREFYVAPENMRAGDDIDDGVDELALTLLAGQIDPLKVRASPETPDTPFAVLDGRRRLFAFQLLIEDGKVSPGHPVDYILCATDEEIDQAIVTSNTQRLAPTEADVLMSIKRMSTQFTADDIAKTLGLDLKRVRRMMKIAALDERLLKLYKNRNLSAEQLRNFARLTDPAAIEELTEVALRGGLKWDSFDAYKATGATVKSDIGKMIDLDAYVAAGGRVERDLFEQNPDTMLDIAIAHQVWIDTTAPIAELLRKEGLEVFHHATEGTDMAKGKLALDRWDYTKFSDRTLKPESDEAAREKAMEAYANAEDKAKANPGGEPYDRKKQLKLLLSVATKGLKAWRLHIAPLEVTAARIKPGRNGAAITFYCDETAYKTRIADVSPPKVDMAAVAKNYVAGVPHSHVKVHNEGYTNGLHERVTRLAGIGLAKSVAAQPHAALYLQVASQFRSCVLNPFDGHNARLLQAQYARTIKSLKADDPLQAPLIDQLNAYKAAYDASGLHPFEFVQSLGVDGALELLAALTAVQIETTETDKGWIKLGTRAEAAHVAQAIGHDIRTILKPDAEFYAGFSKKMLLGFIEAMGQDTKPYAKAKPDELAPIVAELGREHNFVPPALQFELAEEQPEPEASDVTELGPDDEDPAEPSDEDEEQVAELEGAEA